MSVTKFIIKSFNVYLDKREFAQHHGYQIEEYCGGDFLCYIKNGIYKDPSEDMVETFSKFLEKMNIKHEKGIEYLFWKATVQEKKRLQQILVKKKGDNARIEIDCLCPVWGGSLLVCPRESDPLLLICGSINQLIYSQNSGRNDNR